MVGSNRRGKRSIMESFDLIFAHKTRKSYACSVCWGELELVPDQSDNTKWFVLCKRCKEETRGYVTKYFVNRRRGESVGEEFQVTKMLQKIGVLEKPNFGSVFEIMKSLGF